MSEFPVFYIGGGLWFSLMLSFYLFSLNKKHLKVSTGRVSLICFSVTSLLLSHTWGGLIFFTISLGWYFFDKKLRDFGLSQIRSNQSEFIKFAAPVVLVLFLMIFIIIFSKS